MSGHESRVRLTARRVADFTCPADKSQSFLWDTDTPSLALRATPTGRKTYVFESRLNKQTIRVNIGSVKDWPLDAPERDKEAQSARREASRLATMVDQGADPREVQRQQQAAQAASKAAAAANALTVGEVWAAYVTERRPHWGELHYRDHIRKTAPGGERFKRGTGTTVEGPLYALMAMPLRDLTAATVEAWAAKEAKTRPTSARLAWRMLKVFLGWCEEQVAYAHLMPAKNSAKTKKSREHLGRVNKKKDSLQREQLAAWFAAVQNIGNPCISGYLQVMLLTGARPGEIITMRWENVNTQWRGVTIRDKVDKVTKERTIPLTPYVAHLIAALPRRNEWVFASVRNLKMDEHNIGRRAAKASKTANAPTMQSSYTGHITEPNHAHTTACTVAGINGLTLHGLRRSFKSASEWLDIPSGVRQNIMGHVAKSTDEDYTIRPLDLLRVHHEKIEAWILEQAGIKFDVKAASGSLRVVSS